MTTEKQTIDQPRWTAFVMYRTKEGPQRVMHMFEELEELHDIVEAGPDWNTLVSIEVVLTNPLLPGLTVEDAAEL